MKKLLAKFINRIHPYFQVPPYNFFWGKYLKSLKYSSSVNGPIYVVDVGGRGGELPELNVLIKDISYYTFDADKEEAAKLKQQLELKNFNKVTVFDNLLFSSEQQMNFYLYKNPGESSIYLPNRQYWQYFDERFEVDRQVSLPSTSLDLLYEQHKIPDIDFFKIDTQGSELAVLTAAKKTIESVQPLMLEIEVEFYEMYKNQPLFHDISGWMHSNGYELLYLNRVFMGRQKFKGPSRGQIIFGDALFGIKDVSILSRSKKIKYIFLLINYGLVDYAFDIFEEDESLKAVSPELRDFFAKKNRKINGVSRIFYSILDRILFQYLNIRKTNKMRFDSDRSYPVR